MCYTALHIWTAVDAARCKRLSTATQNAIAVLYLSSMLHLQVCVHEVSFSDTQKTLSLILQDRSMPSLHKQITHVAPAAVM